MCEDRRLKTEDRRLLDSAEDAISAPSDGETECVRPTDGPSVFSLRSSTFSLRSSVFSLRSSVFSLVTCITLSGIGTAWGQDETESSSEAKLAAFREQSIYIPYDKLRQTFEKQGRGVFLPYEKFQELWQAARAKVRLPREEGPPVRAVITEIANDARVVNEVVRVSARLKIDLLRKGWIEVPLRLSDAALISATVDDQPVVLVADERGGQKLLLKKDGDDPEQIELKLEYAKSIRKAPGQNSVAFQTPLAPINRWRIRIPESGVKVNVHPMLAATEVPASHFAGTGGSTSQDYDNADEDNGDEDNGEDEGGEDETTDEESAETVVLAFVGAAPTVRIDWTPKAEGASGLDALVGVQTEQQVTIYEGVTRTRTRLAYEVSRAELSELKIEVPLDQKVVNVVDANVRQWSVQAGDHVQTITVGLFQPARSQQAVLVELEVFNEDASRPLTVPVVRAVDVGRQRGLVVVRLADGLRAEPTRRSGLLQLDAAEIPDRLKSQPWAFAYRYAALPFGLDLSVEKVQSRVHVDQLVEAFLEPQKLTLDLFAKYTIQRAGVFELRLDVPAGFEVRRVVGHEAAGAQAVAVDSHVLEASENGAARLKVNLARKAQGQVGLLVELERQLEDPNLLSPTGESSQIDVVPLRVVADSVQRSSGRMVVYAPESLRVAIEQLEGLRNISFDEAFRDTASVRGGRFPDTRPVQAFAFSEGAAAVQLTAQRRQPHVTAKQLLVSRIGAGVVKYETTFFFDIRYSGVKSLRIDLPADLATRVRNETKSLQESPITPIPDDVAEGYVAWSLSGETELIGQNQCKLTWETPLEELGIGKSVDLRVPRLIPQNVDRAEGQIVLVKAETIDAQPKGTPQGLDPIDPQHDLMSGVQIPDAAAALEFHDDWDLTLTATRYQLEVIKNTSIEKAVLRMVITRSDRISVQALYRMRSNRQRLEIELPDEVAPGKIEFDTNPLRINGRRVALERGDDNSTFFVPLVGSNTNEPFVLEMRYTAAGGDERLAYPRFPDEPAVQKVNLVAYVTDERAYVGKRGPWTDESTWRYDDLLQRSPTPRHDIRRLISQLINNIDVGSNPADDFPTDGRPLLFSTLRPVAPDQGALQLTTMNRQLLHGMVFGIVAFAGVLLLRRPAADRLVFVFSLVAALVLCGVFLPTLTNAILNRVFMLALLVVGLLWLAIFARNGVSRLSQFTRSRTPTPESSPPPAAAPEPDASLPEEPSSPPKNAATSEEEGGTLNA